MCKTRRLLREVCQEPSPGAIETTHRCRLHTWQNSFKKELGVFLMLSRIAISRAGCCFQYGRIKNPTCFLPQIPQFTSFLWGVAGCFRMQDEDVGKESYQPFMMMTLALNLISSEPNQKKKKSIRVHWTHIPYPKGLRYFSFSSRMSNSRAGPSECWCVAERYME